MKSILELAIDREPDLTPVPLRIVEHEARGARYELLVCRMLEFGQYRIYVAKDGELCGFSFDPKNSVECEPESSAGLTIIETLLAEEISDINENSFGLY
ncbi:hypothetical protein [Variovorax sp. RCC_210]|uniref:hypothetical protein n=1 Tax=Variovorax sp. RCC_210 TaxID=3239217 RepID=UPI00352536CC